MKKRIALLWVILFAVPLLVVSYIFFPQGATLNIFNNNFSVQYPDSWKTIIWMLSLMLVPAIIAITLILTLSRNTTPWQVFVILFELLILMVWNIDRLVARQQYIEGHELITSALVTCITVGIVILIWKRKQKTEREKKEALLIAINHLTKEDLPAIFNGLTDVEITASEMKETDFVWALKEILKQNVQHPKFITAELINNLTNLKSDNA